MIKETQVKETSKSSTNIVLRFSLHKNPYAPPHEFTSDDIDDVIVTNNNLFYYDNSKKKWCKFNYQL